LRRIADAGQGLAAAFSQRFLLPSRGVLVTIEAPEMEIPTPPSLALRVKNLMRDVRDLVCDHLELAALEARRAGSGFARMVCVAVVISILWVTAWLALLAGAIVWATSAGVPWPGALAIAAVANIVIGAALALWMRKQAGELLFSRTLRQLRRDVNAPKGVVS
jgi:uncharacterized membrane protein YqjE